MLFQKQAFRHNPANNSFGDCHRTCIANMLDLNRDTVPNWGVHYDDTYEFNKAAAEFLASHKLKEIAFSYECSQEAIHNYMKISNPNTYYLLGGKSPRGTNHVVNCFNGEMIWDTAIDGGGLVAPYEDGSYVVYVLTPLL